MAIKWGPRTAAMKRITTNFPGRDSLFFIRYTAIYNFYGMPFHFYSEFRFKFFIDAKTVLSHCCCYSFAVICVMQHYQQCNSATICNHACGPIQLSARLVDISARSVLPTPIPCLAHCTSVNKLYIHSKNICTFGMLFSVSNSFLGY
jgi:hypothetical protein